MTDPDDDDADYDDDFGPMPPPAPVTKATLPANLCPALMGAPLWTSIAGGRRIRPTGW